MESKVRTETRNVLTETRTVLKETRAMLAETRNVAGVPWFVIRSEGETFPIMQAESLDEPPGS